jgi:transposase-like protein
MDKKRTIEIIHDYEENGISYRSLGKKYGVATTTVFRILDSKRKKDKLTAEQQPSKAEEGILPGDEKSLRARLRKLELENELLHSMLDISSKELGIDLRKKHGTRQSK